MNASLPIRAAVAAGAALVLALVAPLAASAHVSVNPAQAEAGSFTQLTLRVPNERDDSGTIRLEVTLPADTPFTSVSYEAVPGWTTTVVRTELPEPVEVAGNEVTEAATSVIWEADPGVEIGPGQYRTFGISVGPVPDVGSILLPATQTYASGEVVAWADDAEGERPAPVLYVNDAPAGHHGAGEEEEPAATDPETVATVTSGGASGEDDDLARGLGIGGLALGAIAVVLAAFALLRRRPDAAR
jgi:uncharacterized protein YcnI